MVWNMFFCALLRLRFCVLFLCPFIVLLHSSQSHSAPALKGPLCLVRGEVERVEKRRHYYTPESWRKDWGLPRYTTYTDIYLRIVLIDSLSTHEFYFESCVEEAQRILGKDSHAYQLGTNNSSVRLFLNPLKVGTCIEGHTQRSGDEFRLGHWLNQIKILDYELCDKSLSINDLSLESDVNAQDDLE